MRILLCAQFYPPINGGEERHVRTLGQGLRRRGHDVDVLTIASGPADVGVTDDAGVRVFRVMSSAQRLPGLRRDTARPHSLPVADPQVRRSAERLLAGNGYDVVHAHNWIAASVLAPARHHDVPVVLTLHDYSHVCAIKRYMRDGQECAGPSPRRCGPCATQHYGVTGVPIAAANVLARRQRSRAVGHVLAVSTAVADRNGLAAAQLPFQVVPNFIPGSALADRDTIAGPAGRDDPIVFVGDLSRDKGVDVLLEAYRHLDDPPPLVLAGRHTDALLDLPPGARLAAELPHDEVMALMRTARCVVVPSIWPDPCPTVVLEAMALGRPVVAAASGGIIDMVDDGRTGLLVAPGNPSALAGALEQVVADPAAAHALGLAGREAVERFTDTEVVPAVESVYAGLCRARLHQRDDENSSLLVSAPAPGAPRLMS